MRLIHLLTDANPLFCGENQRLDPFWLRNSKRVGDKAHPTVVLLPMANTHAVVACPALLFAKESKTNSGWVGEFQARSQCRIVFLGTNQSEAMARLALDQFRMDSSFLIVQPALTIKMCQVSSVKGRRLLAACLPFRHISEQHNANLSIAIGVK